MDFRGILGGIPHGISHEIPHRIPHGILEFLQNRGKSDISVLKYKL